MVFTVGRTTWVPDTATLPSQPSLAVQLVALVEDQVRFEDWPEVIDVGLAVMVTVGAGEVETLLIFMVTAADVVLFPAASLATAVRV